MATQPADGSTDQTFCRECGKPIEADARFCRFCGKPQADGGATLTPSASSAATAPKRSAARTDGLEERLRQLFPRHHLQDEFMHIATIAAFFMALIGFVLGFFPAYTWLADNFLLGAIALILFLILRESTLSHIRGGGAAADGGGRPSGGRYQAGRPGSHLPPEAATTQSSPRPPSPPAPRPAPPPPRA